MAANPSPVIEEPTEQLPLAPRYGTAPIAINVRHVRTKDIIVRLLPMAGVVATIGLSVYSPPTGVVDSVIAIAGELAFAALAIVVWFPKSKSSH